MFNRILIMIDVFNGVFFFVSYIKEEYHLYILLTLPKYGYKKIWIIFT